MMEARLSALFKSEDEYQIIEKFAGKTLKGKRYKPIFDYYAHLKSDGGFQVCWKALFSMTFRLSVFSITKDLKKTIMCDSK